jgi:hypothetical protein
VGIAVLPADLTALVAVSDIKLPFRASPRSSVVSPVLGSLVKVSPVHWRDRHPEVLIAGLPVPWPKLDYDTSLGGYRVDITEDQLKGAPKFNRSTDWNWSDRSRDRTVYDYYNAPLWY